jgi:hypothetical protein
MLTRLREWARRTAARVTAAAAALLVAIAAFLGVGEAPAQAVVDVLSWTNPTTRVDGTPLANLATLRVQWGATPGGPYNGGQLEVAAPATSANVPRPAAGVGTVCYVVTAIDAAGLASDPSAEACKTVVARPSAPSGIAVR